METALHYVATFGDAAAPIIATIIASILSMLFARAVSYLPPFIRTYAEKIYREKEALFKQNITDAIRNGITTAMAKRLNGGDALSFAIDHAIRSNPEAYQHFRDTSNMTRETLGVIAGAEGLKLGIDIEAAAGGVTP